MKKDASFFMYIYIYIYDCKYSELKPNYLLVYRHNT